MRNIDKFILHVVHNWGGLNEALSAKQMQIFMKQFKDEADDLNLSIRDEELKAAIELFDTKFKNNPNVAEKDLAKYSLNQLLRLVRTTSNTKSNTDEITPDVVYHNDDDTIIIYSGDAEGKCITFGRGEKWCITKGSYGTYRYSAHRGYPVFYLVRNRNLPNSNPLSFVAIQVRNKPEDQKYVWTPRNNSPNESNPMSFSELVSDIPYLSDIPDLRNILRYIPITSNAEGRERIYRGGLTFNEWATNLDFEEKKQYIMVRQQYSDLFTGFSKEKFIQKVLPNYDKIAEWISTNPWIMGFQEVLNNIEYFKPSYQKSIISFVNRPGHEASINGDDIIYKTIPFDVSKKLIQANKIPFDETFNAYVTSDGNVIVNIKYNDRNIKVDLITENDSYDNIKLNTRTQKYLFNYPNIDEIPFDKLVKTINDFNLDSNALKNIINNAKENSNGAKQIVNINGKEILFDTANNAIKAYDISNNSVKTAKLNSPGVKEAFIEIAQANPNIIKNIADSILDNDTLSNHRSYLSNEELIDILKEAPDNLLINANKGIYITTFNNEDAIFAFDSNPSLTNFIGYTPTSDDGFLWRSIPFSSFPIPIAYPGFLRKYNITVSDSDILALFNRRGYNSNYSSKVAFAQMNLPRAEGSNLVMTSRDGVIYIINRADPSTSYKVSPNTGKLLPARLPARTLAALAPTAAAAPAAGAPAAAAAPVAPAAGAPRRGRPAGGGGVARANVPDNYPLQLITAFEANNLLNSFNSLSNAVKNKFKGTMQTLTTSRGASFRNNLLGRAGRTISTANISNPWGYVSSVYPITLSNGNVVASLVAQPGNTHYLLTSQGAYPLDSPNQLLAALQQRNLAEIRHYLMREYIQRNPGHLDEIKKLIKDKSTNSK